MEERKSVLEGSQSGKVSASSRCFEIEGKSLGYPTQFPDASSAVGLFAVPSRAAEALIADSGFEVAQVVPGRALSLCPASTIANRTAVFIANSPWPFS